MRDQPATDVDCETAPLGLVFASSHGSLPLVQATQSAESGAEWEAERAELRAAVQWGYDMIRALVNHAGGEVVLQKETCEMRGRLEVIPRGDQIHVRCWKGMTQ